MKLILVDREHRVHIPVEETFDRESLIRMIVRKRNMAHNYNYGSTLRRHLLQEAVLLEKLLERMP